MLQRKAGDGLRVELERAEKEAAEARTERGRLAAEVEGLRDKVEEGEREKRVLRKELEARELLMREVTPAMRLRARYAMSGTDLLFGGICLRARKRCPVLAYSVAVSICVYLCARYVMSGTDRGLHVRHAMSVRDIAYGGICLRARYVMSRY
eukprot:2532746-Rhodomonas_salina.1